MVDVHVLIVKVGDGLEDDNGFLAASRRDEEAGRLVQLEQNAASKRARKVLPSAWRCSSRTHDTPQGQEDMSPSIVCSAVKVARIVVATARGRHEEICDDRGEDGPEGEEHGEQSQEVLLRVG